MFQVQHSSTTVGYGAPCLCPQARSNGCQRSAGGVGVITRLRDFRRLVRIVVFANGKVFCFVAFIKHDAAFKVFAAPS